MKKLVFLLLCVAMASSAFAEQKVKATGTPPTVKGGVNPEKFNSETKEAFDNVLNDLNEQLADIDYDNPKKFLQAMGDSSVYASHGATTRGYGGYKLFTATIGMMIGIQLPESISSMMDDVGEISDSLEKEGDIRLGVSPNIFNAHVGLNMGVFKFIPENLGVLKRDNMYVGLRIGYFNLPDVIEDFNYKSFTFGLTANYQIVEPIKLAGLVTWRGVNLGSGLIYNGATVNIVMDLEDDLNEPIGSSGAVLHMEPKASMNLDVTTFIIPLEAVTAIKLLIFNIPIGIGADLSFGSTSLGFGMVSDTEFRNLQSGYTQDKKGNISVKGGASNSPSFFNFKIMTGLGISAGPVVFDIPITWYPGSGYNFGVTVGAVF